MSLDGWKGPEENQSKRGLEFAIEDLEYQGSTLRTHFSLRISHKPAFSCIKLQADGGWGVTQCKYSNGIKPCKPRKIRARQSCCSPAPGCWLSCAAREWLNETSTRVVWRLSVLTVRGQTLDHFDGSVEPKLGQAPVVVLLRNTLHLHRVRLRRSMQTQTRHAAYVGRHASTCFS